MVDKWNQLSKSSTFRAGLFFQPFCGNNRNWIFRNLEFSGKILEFSEKFLEFSKKNLRVLWENLEFTENWWQSFPILWRRVRILVCSMVYETENFYPLFSETLSLGIKIVEFRQKSLSLANFLSLAGLEFSEKCWINKPVVRLPSFCSFYHWNPMNSNFN